MILDHAINSGIKPVHYDIHTITKAGEKAMKDSDDQKKNNNIKEHIVYFKNVLHPNFETTTWLIQSLMKFMSKHAKSTMVNLKL